MFRLLQSHGGNHAIGPVLVDKLEEFGSVLSFYFIIGGTMFNMSYLCQLLQEKTRGFLTLMGDVISDAMAAMADRSFLTSA